jgi:hypothetical protein
MILDKVHTDMLAYDTSKTIWHEVWVFDFNRKNDYRVGDNLAVDGTKERNDKYLIVWFCKW